ncbi:phosphate ABC transporter substrate-binding protein [Alishewanella sp. d11]|uniref:phosphate ABC transporter substrate-binding protein n=1 Tax=Alishewanella sp. d11 TaxID=3414030 RepID=UPI003BF7A2E2
MYKFLIFAVLCLLSQPAFSAYVVIVNQQNTASITIDDVKKIYSGKMASFPDGTLAKPIMLTDKDPARKVFLDKVLQMNENRFVAIWAKLLFTGNGIPPIELQSTEQVLQLVYSDRYAIGFIHKTQLNSSVKVVAEFR